MELDRLYNEDCIAGMNKMPEGSVDLAFADPPFNIGYKYDVYEDRMKADEYEAWTRKWGAAVVRVLKPTGTFWLAIGDEFAAELKVICQRDLKLYCRSWVIWYYTFGVNCKYKFSRSHAHLFHFVKDPKKFTFNREAILVPSARQLVYADSRAASAGRIPDDTWILRPQDLPDGFQADEDTWYVPRVCGTFAERAGWHGCQMPETLLGRVIKACSHPGETVLDPFGGSGTTLAVAKKLNRRFIGFELSKNYAKRIETRLAGIESGVPLSGDFDASKKAPPTRAGKRRTDIPRSAPYASIRSRTENRDIFRGISEAFFAVRDGFSVDRVIADPYMNEQFIEVCGRLGVPGTPVMLNRTLMNLRKANHFKGLPPARRTVFDVDSKDLDRHKFACEIAIQRFEEGGTTLDYVLCEPVVAREFDRFVLAMLPDSPSPLQIRWVALGIRKAATKISKQSASFAQRVEFRGEPGNPFSSDLSKVPDDPGIYKLWENSGSKRHLYVGVTGNLHDRLQTQFSPMVEFKFWDAPRDHLRLSFTSIDSNAVKDLPMFQSICIRDWKPDFNYNRLAARS